MGVPVSLSSKGIPLVQTFKHLLMRVFPDWPFISGKHKLQNQEFKNIVITPDESHLVCYGWERQKFHLYVHTIKNGSLLHKIPIK